MLYIHLALLSQFLVEVLYIIHSQVAVYRMLFQFIHSQVVVYRVSFQYIPTSRSS